jgi:hypothetical protein
MRSPSGIDLTSDGQVLMVKKALYGLKQARLTFAGKVPKHIKEHIIILINAKCDELERPLSLEEKHYNRPSSY